MVTTGKAVQRGVLFRDAAAIEALCKVDTIVVDKTGTLTEGRPVFKTVISSEPFIEDDVLRMAASLDQLSEHPMASAIVDAANQQGIKLTEPQAFRSDSGIGVTGEVQGQKLTLGNETLMAQHGIELGALTSRAESFRKAGASVVFLGVDGRLAGLIVVEDPIKSTTNKAINELRQHIKSSVILIKSITSNLPVSVDKYSYGKQTNNIGPLLNVMGRICQIATMH